MFFGKTMSKGGIVMSQLKDKIIGEKSAVYEMKRIGADPYGIKIMKDKSIFRIIRITSIKTPLANILKEGMLSAGGDAAVHKLACACKVARTDVLLLGTVAQYKRLIERLKLQPYGGKDIVKRIKKNI